MANGPDIDFGLTVIGFVPGRRVFGRFTLVRQLGRGGMGLVWLAHDEKLKLDVALKFLPEAVGSDEVAVDNLARETRRARELAHPHIVRVYDFHQDERLAGISMEWVDGPTLSGLRLKQPHEAFAPAELGAWVGQLCGALDYAHARAKVVHRDLKPANLMIDAHGDMKIADFGISASVSESVTRVSRVASSSGSPPYMSPQQMMGAAPAVADDIYSFGATLYELVTGKPPFFSGNILAQAQSVVPPPLAARRRELGLPAAEISAAWEETIAACLAKDPAQRPRTAGEIVTRLDGGAAGPSAARVGTAAPTVVGPRPVGAHVPVRNVASAPDAAPSRRAEGPARPPSEGGAVPGDERKRAAEVPGRARVKSRRMLSVGVAAVVLAFGAWGYFGFPVTRERTPEPAPIEPRVGPARGGIAGESPSAGQKGSADEPARRQAEEQAQREALGWVTGLPLSASDNELAALAARLDHYAATAPADRAAAVRAAFEKHQSLVLAEREHLRLASARGGLIIATRPSGAEVTVGGFAVEKTPATLKEVKLGTYPVVIRLAGYEDVRRQAEVHENEFTTLDVALVRSTGTLQIASVPPGLEVDVRSRTADVGSQTVQTPARLEKLPTGGYELTFQRDGWPEQRQTVAVPRNQTVAALAEFVGGALEIVSTPPGAEVWRDEVKLGVTPLDLAEVVPGATTVEVRLAGFHPAAAQGEVRPKETTRITVGLDPVAGLEPGQSRVVMELGLEMLYVPPGTFTMGSPEDEPARDGDESPQTEVTLTEGFWLGKYEVTRSQWQAIMGNSANEASNAEAAAPVDDVSWSEAMAFCHALTEREHETGLLPADFAYTLPTEAQWEYACRAGTTGAFAGSLETMAWCGGDGREAVHPVGGKFPNAWGFYDMHGNAAEWCADWYVDHLPGGSVRDPTGPADGTARVHRGGAWDSEARICRSAFRSAGDPEQHLGGFRVALVPVR